MQAQLNSATAVSANTSPAVLLNAVSFNWPNAKPILHIPHLSIDRAQHVFLYGPSGSGKSTLLNLIAGISQPTSGSLEILGADLSSLSQTQRDEFRAQHMGIIFQQFNLIPYLNVLDNLLLRAEFLQPAKEQAKEHQQQAKDLLAQLGLSAYTEQLAQALSVGQQQRVAVARALMGRPEIIIADEPTSALDADNKYSFMDLLLTHAQHCKSTIIFVSHDKSLQSYFNQCIDIQSFNPASLMNCSL